jgi:3-deoxy-D-manno-octulosonic acid (KDO) 8-phosphate synthase
MTDDLTEHVVYAMRGVQRIFFAVAVRAAVAVRVDVVQAETTERLPMAQADANSSSTNDDG